MSAARANRYKETVHQLLVSSYYLQVHYENLKNFNSKPKSPYLAMTSPLERQSRYQGGYAIGSTASYDSSSAALHPSLSQPATSPDCRETHYPSRTLPRPRRSRGVTPKSTHDPATSRRQMVSTRVSDYLKSLNSMTRSIVLEKEYVEEKHAGEWIAMDETLQEEVVDDYFMPADVHAHYGTLPRTSTSSYGSPQHSRSTLDYRTPPTSPSRQPDTRPSSPPTYFIPPTHNRLHKNQLSYRSKALKNVMNIPLPKPDTANKRDSGLGSDEECPRTSDEDLFHNPLGFTRNHLRSYSLRQKRGGSRNPNSLSRSSTRRMHRTAAGADEPHSKQHPTVSQHPRRYNNGYDAEVDLPDEALLLDHVSSHQPDSTVSRTPVKPSRYSSRARRSLRMQPRILVDKFSTEDEEEKEDEAVVIPNSLSRVASNSSSGSTGNDFDTSHPLFHNQPATVLSNLRRTQSEDSIDTDTESIAAQSNISILSKSTGILTEDESLLSVPGSSVNNLQSRDSRKGLVRSRPQSRRGGSFYQTSTSEFANRRAQFKPNMLRNQQSAQSSPTHTRQSTPSFSRQNTPSLSSPSPSTTDQCTHHLKSPTPSSLAINQRCGSASESITARELNAMSPEYPSSPPDTPIVKSIMRGGVSHLHVHTDNLEEKRESGYISSSSESFPFPARK